MEFLDIVNDQDEVIGQAAREDVYKDFLNHRIVHVIIKNKKGQIALQLRNRNLKKFPLHWCVAGSGHVQAGETYAQAAQRELQEETGIKDQVQFVGKDVFVFKAEKPIKKFITVKYASLSHKKNKMQLSMKKLSNII